MHCRQTYNNIAEFSVCGSVRAWPLIETRHLEQLGPLAFRKDCIIFASMAGDYLYLEVLRAPVSNGKVSCSKHVYRTIDQLL